MDERRTSRSFASDNNSGICPEILAAIAAANSGHAVGYGDDAWTEKTKALFRKEFNPEGNGYISTYFVFSGTGANVFALSLAAGAGESVICAKGAHIGEDETGAVEASLGCVVLPVAEDHGKIRPGALREALGSLGFIHQPQPVCLSLTQPTERGALYSIDEIRGLSRIAHEAGLVVHMDGARLGVAAAALGCAFRECTVDAGVDILSFGGMKNGIGFGEAVLVFKPELDRKAAYLQKARLQLNSKMRFVAAQYEAYLSDGVWRRNALAAIRTARKLEAGLAALPGVELVKQVETNAVFVRLPPGTEEKLRKEWFFYSLDRGVSRFVTSFDTTDDDIESLVRALGRILGQETGR